jgi:hypothetical protein
MQPQTLLEYRDYRYLKLASLLAVVAVLAYWLTAPSGGEAYGGTGFGYVLGIGSALIILVLLWYGIRKRFTPRTVERRQRVRRREVHTTGVGAGKRNSSDRRRVPAEEHWRHGGSLQGWLSAHVYLGLALLVMVSLHAGFRFHWNVHTLAYVLLLIVVASGAYGVVIYYRYPRLIAANMGEHTLEGLLVKLVELDELARVRALGLPDKVNALVARVRLETRVGGNFLQKLIGKSRDCPTGHAIREIHELSKELITGEQPRLMRDLYSVLLQKQHYLAIVRREIMLNARMQFWLYLHVPLSIALAAALFVHVTVILVYW